MISALRHRAIFRLWIGQALSSIGDEMYRVGLIWLAVSLIGPDTGYLAAGQAAALMILSFVGGKWADRWDPIRTMVGVDLIRAAIVMVPVVISFFHPVTLTVLVLVALSLSALAAFFDPALQTTLPNIASDGALLRSATGLMSTTIRFARAIGPTLIGLLSGIVPLIHFFTLDALSFVISALSVRSIRKDAPPVHRPREREMSFLQAIAAGFDSIRGHAGMAYVMWSKAITGGTWNLGFSLGFALLVQHVAPGDARAFGLLVASYGAGNSLGAIWWGNHARPRSGLMMCTGYLALGIGFVLIAASPTVHWMMVAAVAAGFAGPMNELAFSDLIQYRFAVNEISRVFRLRMAVETLSTLLCMAAAPALFRVLGARGTIAVCGVAWVGCGAWGAAHLGVLEGRRVPREMNDAAREAAEAYRR